MQITATSMASGHPTITLGNGQRLGVHHVLPGSRDLVGDFFRSLPAEDRYRRFFQAVPVVGDQLVTQLCDVDQVRHLTWLLLDGGRPVAEVSGVASERAPSVMEVAIAVHPDHRRRGIAVRALEALGAAVPRVDVFSAWIQPDNRACATLMRSIGLEVCFADGVLEARGPVPSWSGPKHEAAALRFAQQLVSGSHVSVAA